MKTDALIAKLAAHPAPTVKPRRLYTQFLGAGVLTAFALAGAVLGFRHDMAFAMTDWGFWAKFSYTLALAIAGFALVERLARPGAAAGFRPWAIAGIIALALTGALAQWLSAAGAHQAHLFFGGSWRVCVPLIVGVSLPIFAGVIAALRRMAPTRPIAAGAAAGLFAGAAGAWVYGFHCTENALVFVGVWYTTGIAAMTALGALTGRWLLRW